MNTTQKGDLFENKVYDLVRELLSQDKFLTPGKRSLLFKKHPYFSRDREKYIIFDLVIETYREGADKPNLIVLMECKDKGRAISIDDLEAFYAKKEQVARANSKCVLFTTSELQESAFNYATNLGIGVARIFDNDSMSWIVERTNKNLTASPTNSVAINVVNALTNKFFVTTYCNTFAIYENKPYTTVDELIFAILIGNS